jgi:PAS domain S-box-containing protein
LENSFLPDPPLSAESLTDHIGELFQAMEAVPIGVAVTDLNGWLLYVNQRILKALGYQRDELVGKNVGILSRMTLDSGAVQGILTRSLEGGWKGELTGYRQDGSSVPVFLETNAMRSRVGEPIAIVWVARDITEQRAFQRRLVAEGKLGTLGLIAHNMAHEIRNHLSAIKLSLYMLEKSREPDTDEALHFSIAREELNRVELFLRTLVNYAKPPKPRFESVNLVEAVNQGLEDARPILNLKSVALFRQFPPMPPFLRLDRGQFAQAVSQVAQNASEAMEHKGEVHVVLKRQPTEEGAWWLVEVRDNGPGIAPHLQERVFEPFFSTTGHQLGLGLSNVRRIMDLHGGTVSIDSTPGRGTTVLLKVPETAAGS